MSKEDDNPLFGNSVTTVRIDDAGGGPYIVVEQCTDDNRGKIILDFDEIETLYKMLNMLKEDHV